MQQMPSLKTVTLADGVEKRLIEYIQQKHLMPGDPLPKEEEIEKNLQVSRNIVREGISRLKSLGLIESRRHRGMVVAKPAPFATIRKLMEANIFTEEEYCELMRLRIVLELGMADYIFERKTAENMSVLRKLAESEAPIYPSEVEFHSYLFNIGGNRIAANFREILMAVFSKFKNESRSIPESTVTHIDICDALEFGSAADFHSVLHAHFKNIEPVLGNTAVKKSFGNP